MAKKPTEETEAKEETKKPITVEKTEKKAGVKAEKATAKAGKRSAKAIKESEEQQAKEERKTQTAEAKPSPKPKPSQKPPRTKLERRSKKFREVAGLIEKDKSYSLADATELATKTNPVKFDATVELHVKLGVDPKQADQNIRGTVAMPSGTGKSARIAVLPDEEQAAAAQKAGADLVGDQVIAALDKEQLNFDILIASPSMMAQLGKYARLLGPKGLMPNPKSGTVTNDIAKAVKEAKAGKVEYRIDSTSIIHLGIGKVSFGSEKLLANLQAVLASIKAAKPGSLKSNYFVSIHLATSMGPSIPIDLNSL